MRYFLTTAVVVFAALFAGCNVDIQSLGGGSGGDGSSGGGSSGGGGSSSSSGGGGSGSCGQGEPCACQQGAQQVCYGGPLETLNVGSCKAGIQSCQGGEWSACVGMTLPAVEVCDGLDNDCDGVVDEGVAACTCTEGETEPCYTGPMGTAGVGVCKSGTRSCVNGEWSVCVGMTLPAAEVCDGLDNDCTGLVDEGILGNGSPCLTGGSGPCAQGVIQCKIGGLTCVPTTLPTVEVCDGLDNDCNGVADDGFLCCPDLVQNGVETDVDCGGPCPVKCAVGQKCNMGVDCVSHACVFTICQAPTCVDAIKNGAESDIDCGGLCAAKCVVGQSCFVDDDCFTHVCAGGVCSAP